MTSATTVYHDGTYAIIRQDDGQGPNYYVRSQATGLRIAVFSTLDSAKMHVSVLLVNSLVGGAA